MNIREKHTYDFLDVLTVKGKRVLDVGCGNGWCSVLLKERGAFVTGVDLLNPSSPTLINLRENNISYIHTLDNVRKTFDTIWCQWTLEHQFNPIGFLETLRSLAPELWLAVPKENTDSYSKGHVVRYNLPMLVEHLRLAGWDVFQGSFLVTPEPSCKDLLAIVKRWPSFDPTGNPWLEQTSAYSPYPTAMDILSSTKENHFNRIFEDYNWPTKEVADV